ncbi:MAG: regulatory iron-sulfur-containing complex subunit RicT, partial [Flavobacteriaceae bacterium]
MGCSSCSSNSSGVPGGCKNNGTCGTDGCNKLTVFDWLSNMETVNEKGRSTLIEVRFKNGRKEYYDNSENLSISVGDLVAVKAEKGYDIGFVTLKGGLIAVQLKKKKITKKSSEFLQVIRKATQKDIDIWTKARGREEDFKKKSRELAISLNLKMKISDVEFQGDDSKAIFYYTAPGRVDFRQLIRDMARQFNTRIEMKQIGLREEASRLGGIGSCGRELCCSTWLTDFRSVTTSAARYQQLSLNPQKLAGQCGKLKCCLNYELDFYQEALKDFPKSNSKILTEKGIAYCQKIDIFKGLLWFVYKNDSVDWHQLSVDNVKEILKINAKGEKIESLE